MLSVTCKYALRAVVYLAVNAQEDKKICIKKISRELDIPTPFLSKILQTLSKHKILSSTKGPTGGFGMGKLPEDIHLMDVIEIIDGSDCFTQCVIGVKKCYELDVPCVLHSRYANYRENIKKMFEISTIADLVKDVKNGKQKINI